MATRKLSYIELHNSVFMQGTNLGNKINADQKGAELLHDDTRQVVWMFYKGKVAFFPLGNIASADVVEVPADIQEALGLLQVASEEPAGPPAIARKRGRPPSKPLAEDLSPAAPVPIPDFDPNDEEAAANHRALVRAASANSHKAAPAIQNDALIQAARTTAMGLKHPPTAQVQTAQEVGRAVTGVSGKPKAISHAQMKIQVAQQMKDPNA